MEEPRKPPAAVQDDARTYIGSMTDDGATNSDLDSFVRPAGQNPSQFTFYRESTPPPLPAYSQDNGIGGKDHGLATTQATRFAEAGGNSGDDERGPGEGNGRRRAGATICGVSKPVFGTAVVVAVILIVALSLGLGLGLAMARKTTTGAVPGASANG
jgi:hypothetical protein